MLNKSSRIFSLQGPKNVNCVLLHIAARLNAGAVASSLTVGFLTDLVSGIAFLMFRPPAYFPPEILAQLQRSGQYPQNYIVPVLNFPAHPQFFASPAAFFNPQAVLTPLRNEPNDLKEKIRTDILRKLNHEGSEGQSPLLPVQEPESTSGMTMFKGTLDNFGKNIRSPTWRENSGIKRSRSSTPTDSKKPRMGNGKDQSFPTGIRWSTPKAIPTAGSEKISESIWQYFLQNQQTDDIYQAKVQLRNALYAICQGVFPYCGLYIVGSSMNGFGTRTSDMDLCLMLSTQLIDQRKEATEILFLLQKSMRTCSFIKNCQVIRAAVPILRFWDKYREFECDLNINNAVGIRNTHLLRYYATMDWRVRPLMLYIKCWARFQDINDARKMTISSYSLGLMLIHYLQIGCVPPVLPCLQKQFPKVFQPSADIRVLKLNEKLPWSETQNNESLGELFLGFLEYYSFKFNFDEEAISIRLGARVPRELLIRQTENQRQWKCLCIEEPFDYSNTARSVYDEFTFQRIQRVFRSSYLQLRKTKDVQSIISVPF